MFRTHLKNVEVQMGQIAQDANRRQLGDLPSDTISSSKGKEQCNANTQVRKATQVSNGLGAGI